MTQEELRSDEPRWLDPKMRVKRWMSPRTICVNPDTPVDEAFALMRQYHVRHLLVLDDERLVGIVTDRDLRMPTRVGRPWTVAEAYLVGHDLEVRSVMTPQPITVEASDITSYAARLMTDNEIGCLPVMQDGKLAGILTTTDLLKALSYAIDPASA